MRTTLSIDEDVLERARKAAGRLRLPFNTVVNEALRLGLKKVAAGHSVAVRNVPYKKRPTATPSSQGSLPLDHYCCRCGSHLAP